VPDDQLPKMLGVTSASSESHPRGISLSDRTIG
jgi:hypothetical protein